jgi:hypothetical protein
VLVFELSGLSPRRYSNLKCSEVLEQSFRLGFDDKRIARQGNCACSKADHKASQRFWSRAQEYVQVVDTGSIDDVPESAQLLGKSGSPLRKAGATESRSKQDAAFGLGALKRRPYNVAQTEWIHSWLEAGLGLDCGSVASGLADAGVGTGGWGAGDVRSAE